MQLSLTSLPHKLFRLLRVDRRAGLRDSPVTLHRRRIFIMPTRYGLLFAALVLVMLVGSTNYNNSAGFLLTFLLISVGLVTILHTYHNLAGLTFRSGRIDPVFCGEAARFAIVVHNSGGTERCAIALAIGAQAPVLLDVKANADTPLELSVPTRTRGLRRAGVITVFTRYPLGLFHAWSRINLDMQCLVYPSPAAHFSALQTAGAVGEGRQVPRPGNDDFIGFRDYQLGDSPRHVDWKASARGQRSLTKVFADHESDELWLDWDDHAGLDVETRLSRLCRTALSAEEDGKTYGMRLPGGLIPPGRGRTHLHECLRALALFGKA